jgi:hypothetical protein
MTTTTTNGRPALTGEAVMDRPGAPHFRVPLSGRDGAGRFALIDEAGLRTLQQAGAKSLFLVSDAQGRFYVCFVPRGGSPMTAARAIMGDPVGQRIEHISGDRLDLRRSNLMPRKYAKVGDGRLAARRSVESAFLKPVSQQAQAAAA